MKHLLQNGEVKSSKVTTANLSQIYSKEEIWNVSTLGDVLKKIRARLKSEGVSIEEERQKLLERAKKS